MDNLVLIRVASACATSLVGAVVRDLREETPRRFRLLLSAGERPRSLVFSLGPGPPWVARPAPRGRYGGGRPGPFAAAAAKGLRGAVVDAVEKPAEERRLTLHFADGTRLVAELVPGRPDLLWIDARGTVMAGARGGRRARSSRRVGRPYVPPPLPAAHFNPFGAKVEEIRRRLDTVGPVIDPRGLLAAGLGPIGKTAAELVVEESRRSGQDPARVLERRLGRVVRGEDEPVIEAPDDPLEAAERGVFDPGRYRLLPWTPPWPAAEGLRRMSDGDAAATAGRYHEAAERSATDRARGRSLANLLERQVRRLREVEARARADARSFEDPDRYRRWGEALLAGMKQARRAGQHVLVPDPYRPEGPPLSVPVAPGVRLARAAEECFARHRRARRGLARARERAGDVSRRRQRLEGLAGRQGVPVAPGSILDLEHAMQLEGIPVGLEPPGRAPGRVGSPASPRLEGVRLFLSADGDTILIGRSGPDNQRLTFKLAGPEDFWFHAQGVRGAHVVARNRQRRSRPPESTLRQAAEAAAWFSEAREQAFADVQWTRRKYVRRPRGARPGTVTIKRFETLRVRPRQPEALEGSS